MLVRRIETHGYTKDQASRNLDRGTLLDQTVTRNPGHKGKTNKETETKEQNTHPTKTNLEIRT